MSIPKHYFIRVGDGTNFRNSNYNVWGMTKCNYGMIKKNLKTGDLLWFITPKISKKKKVENGGKIIAVCKFVAMYNREKDTDNTYTNEEMNWIGGENWCIQIYYENKINLENKNLNLVIRCAASCIKYESVIDQINIDLNEEYRKIS
jgi:hypothetical protein